MYLLTPHLKGTCENTRPGISSKRGEKKCKKNRYGFREGNKSMDRRNDNFLENIEAVMEILKIHKLFQLLNLNYFTLRRKILVGSSGT